MGNISLKFEARDDHGNNLGDYEMFVDLTSTVANPTSLLFEVPTGWAVQAIKFYQVTENNSGGFTPSAQKKTDMASLHPGSPQSAFNAVFSNMTIPSGFSFDTATSTLTDTGQSPGAFEYLIWIQKPSTSANDYIDPGIRNH